VKPLAALNARAIKAHAEHPFLGRNPVPSRRSTMRNPHKAERLHTSKLDGCLTHITRLVTVHANRRSAQSLCGNLQLAPVWVDPADETFICRRCHRIAGVYGVPTFGLIPDSGCTISGGKRGLRARP